MTSCPLGGGGGHGRRLYLSQVGDSVALRSARGHGGTPVRGACVPPPMCGSQNPQRQRQQQRLPLPLPPKGKTGQRGVRREAWSHRVRVVRLPSTVCAGAGGSSSGGGSASAVGDGGRGRSATSPTSSTVTKSLMLKGKGSSSSSLSV